MKLLQNHRHSLEGREGPMDFRADPPGNDSMSNRYSQTHRLREERRRRELEVKGRQEVIPSTIDNHNSRPVPEPTFHESQVAQRVAEVESQLLRDNADNHDERPGLLWGDDAENEAGARITDDNEAVAPGNKSKVRNGFWDMLQQKSRRQKREDIMRGHMG